MLPTSFGATCLSTRCKGCVAGWFQTYCNSQSHQTLPAFWQGKKLGDALLPPGQQAAASTTIITVPAQLNGLSTIGMSFALLRDWENKSVEMDIVARFTGTVDLIKLIPHEFIVSPSRSCFIV